MVGAGRSSLDLSIGSGAKKLECNIEGHSIVLEVLGNGAGFYLKTI